MEGYRRIRIPTILSDSEMFDQDIEGAGGADARDPVLAGPAMVPVAAGADVRASVDSSEEGAFVGPDGPTTSTGAIDSTNRLAVVRNQMESSGLSDQVVKLLLGGVRNPTSAAYQSAWNAPLVRSDATSVSPISFPSALKCMLLPGRFWYGTSKNGIFAPKDTASNTDPSDVSDGQKEENRRTLPPTVGGDIATGDKRVETNLDPRLNEDPGLEPRLLKLPWRVKPDPVLPFFVPRELPLGLL
ncbi:hypothetical protein OUZ56_003318 [Daphnia magna]|uniref:Uncharacterized protein n=1 Tax=Daphnia magna TaxID=35525 RepID=A0ABR0A8E2_9CRUS|nr:hypothetical protein OUZ56_003318 [Daphnia magna]